MTPRASQNIVKFQSKANSLRDAKFVKLRLTTLLEEFLHAMKRFSAALVRSYSESVPPDNANDSSLTPRGNEHRTLHKSTRLECPITETRLATALVSRSFVSFSELRSNCMIFWVSGSAGVRSIASHRSAAMQAACSCPLAVLS